MMNAATSPLSPALANLIATQIQLIELDIAANATQRLINSVSRENTLTFRVPAGETMPVSKETLGTYAKSGMTEAEVVHALAEGVVPDLSMAQFMAALRHGTSISTEVTSS